MDFDTATIKSEDYVNKVRLQLEVWGSAYKDGDDPYQEAEELALSNEAPMEKAIAGMVWTDLGAIAEDSDQLDAILEGINLALQALRSGFRDIHGDQ